MTMTGGCQCGALRYRAEGEPLIQGFCHCRNCQRISGAGHIGFICFPEGAVVVEGATRSYSLTGGSGRTATRYFCPTCHSDVFGRAEVMAGRINLYAGSLDDTVAVPAEHRDLYRQPAGLGHVLARPEVLRDGAGFLKLARLSERQ